MAACYDIYVNDVAAPHVLPVTTVLVPAPPPRW